MRIFIVSIFALVISFVCFLIIKLWGQSQAYYDYKHPLFTDQKSPIVFYKPSFKNILTELSTDHDLYLDVAVTQDQNLVIPLRTWLKSEKPIRYLAYADIKKDVISLQDIKNQLSSKKLIFNITENAQAVHEIFFENIRLMGFEKGQNFIVTSPYEAPVKALKELAPAFIYGSTQPEILKIVAMGSMHLYEAVNIRADILIHPLKLKNQLFFTDELIKEVARRYKRIIVGPISEAEKEQAVKLNPYGLIIEN